MPLAFWCHLLFFMISMHKILNYFCLSVEPFIIMWAEETRSESDRFQSKTVSVNDRRYITLIHVKSKPVSIGFPCHLGSSGILPHLLWQKAPQVLCPNCQPHVGVSDNNILLIWLCGLTLRQSNAIQRVFYRTVSVLKWVSVCVYTNICMFAYICNF